MAKISLNYIMDSPFRGLEELNDI